MSWVPEAQAIVAVCLGYGYTLEAVAQLTESQFNLLLAGLVWRNRVVAKREQ